MGELGTMTERVIQSESAERTFALGEALGRVLAPGHFIGLIGDLGAGKTQLARGIAAGAGVAPSEVASPTFAIVYPYRGRIPLNHADLYRIADRDELYATGFFDLPSSGAMLVEWLDRIPEAAPADHLQIRIDVVDDDRRRIIARASGPLHAALLSAWDPR
jgi:tRNA threonylcarbamoyladenosine biosynthesis protein TsaE